MQEVSYMVAKKASALRPMPFGNFLFCLEEAKNVVRYIFIVAGCSNHAKVASGFYHRHLFIEIHAALNSGHGNAGMGFPCKSQADFSSLASST